MLKHKVTSFFDIAAGQYIIPQNYQLSSILKQTNIYIIKLI